MPKPSGVINKSIFISFFNYALFSLFEFIFICLLNSRTQLINIQNTGWQQIMWCLPFASLLLLLCSFSFNLNTLNWCLVWCVYLSSVSYFMCNGQTRYVCLHTRTMKIMLNIPAAPFEKIKSTILLYLRQRRYERQRSNQPKQTIVITLYTYNKMHTQTHFELRDC